jgi:hypothetical protein
VKKYFLFILSFFIWLAVAASWNDKKFFARSADAWNHSVFSVNYSHAEWSSCKYSVGMTGNCRQHSSANFIVAGQLKSRNAFCFLKPNNSYLAYFPSKKYLLHIYPSHTFW